MADDLVAGDREEPGVGAGEQRLDLAAAPVLEAADDIGLGRRDVRDRLDLDLVEAAQQIGALGERPDLDARAARRPAPA